MATANLPANSTPGSTQVDKPKRVSTLGVNFEKAKPHLPGAPDKEYRMGLDHERELITALTKAGTHAFAGGNPTDLASLLKGQYGDWLRKCQSRLYTELARQGIDNTYKVFLPLFNEAKSPLKKALEQLVTNCHEAVPGGKALKFAPFVWCGNDG